MNYLVLGASGFIGTALAGFLKERGLAFATTGRTEPKEHQQSWVQTDYSTSSLVQLMGVQPRPTAVILLASIRQAALGKGASFGSEEYLKNSELFTKVADACRLAGITDLVVASSIAVYSSEPRPWTEDRDDIPATLYGQSKKDIDSLGQFYSNHRGIRVKSLRLAQVLGLGEHPGYLLNTWIDLAARKQPLRLAGSGQGRRQFLYVQDAAEALIHFSSPSVPAGLYNIAMPGTISIRELGMLINRCFENTAGIDQDLAAPEDRNSYEMSTQKALKAGWSARYDLEMALRELSRQRTSFGETVLGGLK